MTTSSPTFDAHDPGSLAGALGEVAVAGGELADTLVDEVFVVEALRGGVLVRVGGRVDDAEVLGDTPHLVGDVADLALHGVDQLLLQPPDRAVVDLGRDEPLHRGQDQLLDLGDHADLGARVERVAEQLVELGAEGGEGADEGAVVLVEQTARGAGDLVDRVGDAGLEARLELVERALDHVDVDGDVGGPQGPGTDAQALADRRQRVVGLGDDAHDLGVVLLELTDVDDAVGDEDPSRVVFGGSALISPPQTAVADPPSRQCQYPTGV